MRSSKSRSRSKPNRPRTLGNIINRVFDSSGPEGKVRGTPQQLIEKYQQLGRDAQLSNDRVAAENFMQHSEHYTRLLAEAQREMAAEQEARQTQQQQNGNGNGNGGYGQPRNDRPDFRNDRGEGGQQPRFDQPRNDGQRNDGQRNDQPRNDGQRNDGQRNEQPRNDGPRNDNQRNDPSRHDQPRHDQPRNDQPRQDSRSDQRHDQRPDRRDDRRVVPADVVTFAEVDEETGLVETPEARRALPVVEEPPVALTPDDVPAREETAKRARAPRRPRVAADGDAPTPAPEKPTRTRGPAKPREAAE